MYETARADWWRREKARCREHGAALRAFMPPDTWNELAPQDKPAAADVACTALCRMWGIAKHALAFEEFEDEDQHGVCEEEPPRVTLARWLLADAPKLITALAHELRHGYQNAVLDLTLPHPLGEPGLRSWRQAHDDYDQGWFLNQYSNELELDAEIAEEGVREGYLLGR
jgi:hypothetical protein